MPPIQGITQGLFLSGKVNNFWAIIVLDMHPAFCHALPTLKANFLRHFESSDNLDIGID
jgi:hypothetical protein